MARYDPKMSDATRAEITNGIWLCRNCHKIIDRDPPVYPADLLYAWRAEHERYVLSNLGSASDRVRPEASSAYLSEFDRYPPVVKRIAIDRPPGWEWRLTAELLRYLNGPILKKLNDLRGGYYTLPSLRIDNSQSMVWVNGQLHEAQKLIQPMEKVLSRLTASWGPPGQPGDIAEIHHSCLLLRDALERAVLHEEQVWFVEIDPDYGRLAELLRDIIGSQIGQFETIPDALDEVVSLIDAEHPGTKEEPYIIQKTMTFTLPDGWEKQFTREMKRVTDKKVREINGGNSAQFWSTFWIVIIVIILAFAIF